MKKLLNRVTISGADDNTSIEDMTLLTEEFPWVEWGILLHKKLMGEQRYPSESWLEQLSQVSLPLSGHFCGQWIRSIVKCEWGFFAEYPQLISTFDRWQLNMSPYYKDLSRADCEQFILAFPYLEKNVQFIFQVQGFESIAYRAHDFGLNIAMLYDCSGGQGILPEHWLSATNSSHPTRGYAGGLTPGNIQEELQKIGEIVQGPIWIDVESGVRTDNELDLNKVREFLVASKDWVTEIV